MVHFPELPLFVRSEGCEGRLPGVRVHRKGILLDYQLNFFGELLQHLLEEGLKPRTVRSLVIIINGNGDGSVSRPFKWKPTHIDLVDALEQYDLETFFCAARNRERIPSG